MSKQTKKIEAIMQEITALEEFSSETATTVQLLEEESVTCPDCSDVMIRFYDWNKLRYQCENCGLISSKIFCEDET